MTSLLPPTHRRTRGAPLGNTNAVKHGFYSRSFTSQEKHHLESGLKGELQDEEDLLRTLINRTILSMKDAPLPAEAMVIALRAISLAVGRIESIHRSRKVVYDDQEDDIFHKILEEINNRPPEEGGLNYLPPKKDER